MEQLSVDPPVECHRQSRAIINVTKTAEASLEMNRHVGVNPVSFPNGCGHIGSGFWVAAFAIFIRPQYLDSRRRDFQTHQRNIVALKKFVRWVGRSGPAGSRDRPSSPQKTHQDRHPACDRVASKTIHKSSLVIPSHGQGPTALGQR
jgi:hypothetical protein